MHRKNYTLNSKKLILNSFITMPRYSTSEKLRFGYALEKLYTYSYLSDDWKKLFQCLHSESVYLKSISFHKFVPLLYLWHNAR